MLEVQLPPFPAWPGPWGPPLRGWEGDGVICQLYEESGHQRLTIMRVPPERPFSWEELQEIKSAAGFGDAWAVEIYPPDEHAFNDIDARHLWLVDDVPFARRRVVS